MADAEPCAPTTARWRLRALIGGRAGRPAQPRRSLWRRSRATCRLSSLLAAGAPVDYSGTKDNCSPLFIACQQDPGDRRRATGAGADVLKASDGRGAALPRRRAMTTVKALLDASVGRPDDGQRAHAALLGEPRATPRSCRRCSTRRSSTSRATTRTRRLPRVQQGLRRRRGAADGAGRQGRPHRQGGQHAPHLRGDRGEAKVVRVLIDVKADIEFTNESEGAHPHADAHRQLRRGARHLRPRRRADRPAGDDGDLGVGMACSNGKIDRAQSFRTTARRARPWAHLPRSRPLRSSRRCSATTTSSSTCR